MTSLLAKSLLFGVAVGIGGAVMGLLPFGSDFEESAGLDLLFLVRGFRQPPGEVTVIAVDKESADRYGLPPDPRRWPRSFHGRLVDRLAKAGAAVIVFDLFFEEPRDPADDRRFAESVARAGNVVLSERLRDVIAAPGAGKDPSAAGLSLTKTVPLLPSLSRAAAAVASYPLPKVPYRVSRDWTFTKEARDGPTLPVAAFQVYARSAYGRFARRLANVRPGIADRLPADGETLAGGGRAGETAQALREIFEADPSLGERMRSDLASAGAARDGARETATLSSLIGIYGGESRKYLNFYGPPRTIATVSYHRLLPPDGKGADGGLPFPDMRGKAVFVGISDVSPMDQKDSFYTVYSRPNGLDISGVEIAATSFANLLEGTALRRKDGASRIALLFLFGFAAGLLCRLSSPLPAALGLAVFCTLYAVASVREFSLGAVWYPVAVPLFFQAPIGFLGGVLWRYVDTNRERRNIRKVFAYYLPAEVVDRLTGNIAGILERGRVVHGIVLNTDVEDYTGLAESRDPEELGGLMNRYYEAVFRPVRDHGGEVSNVVGDSMLAVWVSAAPDPGNRGKACAAALDIARAIAVFDREPGTPALPTRIGIHAGPILLGNLGAGDHYEYRPVGDIVNTAARIEGLNKQLGTRILVSGEVIERLDGFVARDLGAFRFLGKSRALSVHELIGRRDGCDGRAVEAVPVFEAGLDAFRRRSWEEAAGRFREAAGILGGDGPSRFYLELCERYRVAPPEEGWDGAVCVDRK
jgi:adenylate cyclase